MWQCNQGGGIRMSEVTYTVDENGKYVCSCGNFVGSRSGWYKHKKKVHAVQRTPPKVEVQNEPQEVELDDESPDVDVDDSPSWMDFGMEIEDESTVQMPKPLKALHRKAVERKRGKMSKEGLFKGGRGSGLLARIPLIGRLFRRKRKQVQIPVEEVIPLE
jgi:hypothetical protein